MNDKNKNAKNIPFSGTSANLLRRRKERQENRGKSESADWEGADPNLIQKLIGLVTFHKGTITFGYTKDGGAYYLNYYFAGEAEKVYIRPTEDIDMRLADEIESFSTA